MKGGTADVNVEQDSLGGKNPVIPQMGEPPSSELFSDGKMEKILPSGSNFFLWTREAEYPHFNVPCDENFHRAGFLTRVLDTFNIIFCLDQVSGSYRSLNIAFLSYGVIIMFVLAIYGEYYTTPDVPEPWDNLTDTPLLVAFFFLISTAALPAMAGQHNRSKQWVHAIGVLGCLGIVLVIFDSSLWDRVGSFEDAKSALITLSFGSTCLLGFLNIMMLFRICCPAIWNDDAGGLFNSASLSELYSVMYVKDLLQPVPPAPSRPRVLARSYDYMDIEWESPCALNNRVVTYKVDAQSSDVGWNGPFKEMIADVKELDYSSVGCCRSPDPDTRYPYKHHFEQDEPDPIQDDGERGNLPSLMVPEPHLRSKLRCRVTGLQPGTRYAFKIRAVTPKPAIPVRARDGTLVDVMEKAPGSQAEYRVKQSAQDSGIMDDLDVEEVEKAQNSIFYGGGRLGRPSTATYPLSTLAAPESHGLCADAPNPEEYSQPVALPPDWKHGVKPYLSLKDFPTPDDWTHYMTHPNRMGYSKEETMNALMEELREQECESVEVLPDRKDYRGFIDYCLLFFFPFPDTESPFCRLKFKYYIHSLPPKIRGTVLLGLAIITLAIAITIWAADEAVVAVDDERDKFYQAWQDAATINAIVNITESVTITELLKNNYDLYDGLHDPLVWGFTCAIIVAASFTFCTLPCSMMAYKKKVQDLRIGKPSFYVDHQLYEGYYATGFYGAYMSFVALGFILVYVIIFVIIFTIVWDDTWNAVWIPIIKWFCWYMISWVLDFIFFRTYLFNVFCCYGEYNQWLRNPSLYYFTDSAMTCYYVPQNAMAAIYRMIYIFCFAIISCFRIDVDMMPHGGETYDSGFTSFTAVMLMHERQRNPILLYFFESLSMPYPEPRVSRRAQIRWKLALLLLKNPSLRKYRRFKKEEAEPSASIKNFTGDSPNLQSVNFTAEENPIARIKVKGDDQEIRVI